MKFSIVSKMVIVMALVSSCQSQTASFDLYQLKFDEKIDDIVIQNKLKMSDGISEAKTLFGYDRFETKKEGLLQFAGLALIGENTEQKNKLILHYNEENHILAMYEVLLYTEKEVQGLSSVLEQKIGKPDHESENTDGLEMKVWKDEKTKIYYFLMSYDDKNKQRKTEFTAIDMKQDKAKDWISFRSFHYFL